MACGKAVRCNGASNPPLSRFEARPARRPWTRPPDVRHGHAMEDVAVTGACALPPCRRV